MLLHYKRYEDAEKENDSRKMSGSNIPCACRSACGFQSESYMITTLALVRFIPTPPAFVDNRNTSLFLCGLLYLSIAACLYLALICPSILSYLSPLTCTTESPSIVMLHTPLIKTLLSLATI